MQLVIVGGDGNFTVTNSNKETVAVDTDDRQIDITPLTTGSSVVTIVDQASNSYTLDVTVDYYKFGMIILKQEIVVVGDKLSDEQKAEIRQKALLTFPVKVKGGFKLVYKEGREARKGEALIYKETFGADGIESTFEVKDFEYDLTGVKETHSLYVITIDGKPREFILARYIAPKSKSTGVPIQNITLALHEILTDQFKAEYPDVEKVYTQQVFPNTPM